MTLKSYGSCNSRQSHDDNHTVDDELIHDDEPRRRRTSACSQPIMAAQDNGPQARRAPSDPKSEVDSRQAWLTLALVFVLNANTLGALKVYGVIFDEVVRQKQYNREDASWPISTATTIQNLAGLLTPLLAMKVSWRSVELLQTALFVSSNLGAYLSTSLGVDILCLGIVQGVALSLRYNMNVMINNEYFSKYRATAMGISLAGSSCGVFVLKPLINYVIDATKPNFRNAYLALAAVMSSNFILNWFIRKPTKFELATPELVVEATRLDSLSADQQQQQQQQQTNPRHQQQLIDDDETIRVKVARLLKMPALHCIWIMQTIYFYISRTYPIFMVDFGSDVGLAKSQSRSLLDFWVFGELSGRFLLGGLVDSRLTGLGASLTIVNLLLSVAGLGLIAEPKLIAVAATQAANSATLGGNNATLLSPLAATGDPQTAQAQAHASGYLFCSLGLTIALIGALSSLVNMMIVPFGQEYLGKRQVPWAYAIASVITSLFLLLRPVLIGLSRDTYKTYDLLIAVMALSPLAYSVIFQLLHLSRLLRLAQAPPSPTRPK